MGCSNSYVEEDSDESSSYESRSDEDKEESKKHKHKHEHKDKKHKKHEKHKKHKKHKNQNYYEPSPSPYGEYYREGVVPGSDGGLQYRERQIISPNGYVHQTQIVGGGINTNLNQNNYY